MKTDDPLPPLTVRPIEAVDGVREPDRIMLVLAYLGPLALIPLLTVKDSPLVRWHAKNGLVLAVAGVLTFVGVVPMLVLLPVVGLLSSCLIYPAFLAVDLYAMVKATRGVRWRIPGVTAIAERL